MKMMDRIIGIWMMIAGVGLFMFANMLVPYIHSLYGVTFYITFVSTAIFFVVPSGALIGFGMVQVAGAITIRVERGK